MEHEVFVPVAAEPLRRVLADPARVARAVPGLQQDTAEAPVAGRLKVRFGGSSITYRGTLRIVARDDGRYALDGAAAEARGSGRVEVALTLRLTAADGGTTLVFDGDVHGDGRFATLDARVAGTAGRRLLNRFAAGLAENAPDGHGAADSGAPPDTEPAPTVPQDPPAGPEESLTGPERDTTPVAPPVPDPAPAAPEPVPDASQAPDASPGPAPDAAGQPEPHVPADQAPDHGAPPGDDGADLPTVSGGDRSRIEEANGGADGVDDEPPAEAAHARRTMIGRSAEEVDHAPPRGRYAPVPAPTGVTASLTLRWAAPAAALVVASAIVLGRALRRRR